MSIQAARIKFSRWRSYATPKLKKNLMQKISGREMRILFKISRNSFFFEKISIRLAKSLWSAFSGGLLHGILLSYLRSWPSGSGVGEFCLKLICFVQNLSFFEVSNSIFISKNTLFQSNFRFRSSHKWALQGYHAMARSCGHHPLRPGEWIFSSVIIWFLDLQHTIFQNKTSNYTNVFHQNS